mmetsp:Transcript_47170/g.86574  ORF Transcript_47170/g.86574 Transcript_47170/m.86574 type:complete len:632 (-) Transcript_47170:84-1979(-)
MPDGEEVSLPVNGANANCEAAGHEGEVTDVVIDLEARPSDKKSKREEKAVLKAARKEEKASRKREKQVQREEQKAKRKADHFTSTAAKKLSINGATADLPEAVADAFWTAERHEELQKATAIGNKATDKPRFTGIYRPTIMCRHFISSRCLRGNQCKFAHHRSELHPEVREKLDALEQQHQQQQSALKKQRLLAAANLPSEKVVVVDDANDDESPTRHTSSMSLQDDPSVQVSQASKLVHPRMERSARCATIGNNGLQMSAPSSVVPATPVVEAPQPPARTEAWSEHISPASPRSPSDNGSSAPLPTQVVLLPLRPRCTETWSPPSSPPYPPVAFINPVTPAVVHDGAGTWTQYSTMQQATAAPVTPTVPMILQHSPTGPMTPPLAPSLPMSPQHSPQPKSVGRVRDKLLFAPCSASPGPSVHDSAVCSFPLGAPPVDNNLDELEHECLELEVLSEAHQYHEEWEAAQQENRHSSVEDTAPTPNVVEEAQETVNEVLVRDPRLEDPSYALVQPHVRKSALRPPSPDLDALDSEVTQLEEWAEDWMGGSQAWQHAEAAASAQGVEAESDTEDSDGAASSYAAQYEEADGEIGAALDNLVAWAHVMAEYEVLPDAPKAAEEASEKMPAQLPAG